WCSTVSVRRVSRTRRPPSRTKSGTSTAARRWPSAASGAMRSAAESRAARSSIQERRGDPDSGGTRGAAVRRPLQVGVDGRREVAVENAVRVAVLLAGPVVLDHPVGMKHVRADLAAPLDRLLLADALLLLGPPLVERALVEAGPKHPHRHVAVASLAPLVL